METITTAMITAINVVFFFFGLAAGVVALFGLVVVLEGVPGAVVPVSMVVSAGVVLLAGVVAILVVLIGVVVAGPVVRGANTLFDAIMAQYPRSLLEEYCEK